MKNISGRYWFATLFFLIISSLIVSLWFKNGTYIGGGEANLATWNAGKMVNIYQHTWIDFGLGYPSPFWLARLPMYFLADLLSNLFNPVIVQAIIFAILIFVGGFGMYLLTKYMLGDRNNLIPLLAGSFYILNLYTQSQVWARFIFAGFFAWASLPLLLFLWIKWFVDGKKRYLFLFAFSSMLFSSAYSHPAFIISFWLVALLFSVFKLFEREINFKTKKVLILRLVLGISSWLLVNIWWIYPYFKLQSSVVSNIHDWKYDLASLGGVSADSKIMDILLLRHKFFFERLDYWGDFYKSGLAYFISFIILIITLFGFIKAKVIKEYKYLVILAIIGLLICKGTNPPFGNTLFGFLFEYVPLARVFRSSYEKFGTVWLMVYSIFFAYGFGFLYERVSRVWKSILTVIFIPLILILLVWPMWKGPFSPQAKIFIPNDYAASDQYLNEQGITGRILSLPIIPGEGVKYNWGKTSYYGLDPSDILFSQPVVSKTVRYGYADDKYMTTYDTFIVGKNVDKLLSEMDIEYLIVHNEMESKYSNASSAAEVRETLKKYSEINFVKSIGFLDIYKNTKYLSDSHIIIDGDVSYSYKKIDSGHYVVNVTKATKPFKIILKDSFSPLWVAKIGDEYISDHFVSYDYANSWTVDKKGDYTINLIFEVWPDFLSRTH